MQNYKLFRSTHSQAMMLLVPAVGIYAIFAIWPMIDVFILSFQRWNGLDANRAFAGIENDNDIFTKVPVFWVAFQNTIIWTVLSVISPPAIGLLLALVLRQDKHMWTLPLGLMSFQGQFSSDYGQLNAAIIMTVLPAVLVYLIFQRYFVSGLTSGAVKG